MQVRQNSGSDNLANLREDDLVGILDDQNARADRLRQQIADLQDTLRQLQEQRRPVGGGAPAGRSRTRARSASCSAPCRRPGPASR